MSYPAVLLLFLYSVSRSHSACLAFSPPMKMSVGGGGHDVTEAATLAKRRLREALSSPSGKLTISPEIVIPEPTDPTALLLQATNVKKLSGLLRTAANANSAWISGSANALRQFTVEQEDARGSFPGPLPVVYCRSDIGEALPDTEELNEIAETGVSGILVALKGGQEISSVADLEIDESMQLLFEEALSCGLQPIPEIVLANTVSWEEDHITSIVNKLTDQMGTEPACVVLSVGTEAEESPDDDDTSNDVKVEESCFPKISKTLKKAVPILGSVRVLAGEDRVGDYTARLKEAGFTGALLRSDCIPGFRMNPDLEFVAAFWGSVISQLKSTRSKSFSFRSKVAVALDKDVPMQWAKYQKSIMDSGALGESASSAGFDPNSGDHQGF